MKKFLLLLLASVMTACAFTSCGRTEDDGDSDQGSLAAEEDTTAGEEQSGTEEDTNNIQPETDNNINPAFGKWEFVDDYMIDVTVIEIKDSDNASVVVTQDMADRIYFDEEKNFVFPGMTFSADDYDFDGKTFVLHGMSENDLTMEKIDGSEDLFGEYRWISGELYSFVSTWAADSDAPLFMNCAEGSTTLYLDMDMEGFSLTDDTITIDGGAFGENTLFKPIINAPYTVDGDVMIVTNSDGEELKFTRIREYLTSESETNIMR